MSHFTTITTQVRDLEALRDACQEMKLRLETASQARGQKIDSRGYAGSVLPCDAVIRCDGPYDVGLNRQADGTYAMVTDWYNDHVEKQVGKNYGKLLQIYGIHCATRTAKKQGYNVARQAGKNGAIQLLITGRTL